MENSDGNKKHSTELKKFAIQIMKYSEVIKIK